LKATIWMSRNRQIHLDTFSIFYMKMVKMIMLFGIVIFFRSKEVVFALEVYLTKQGLNIWNSHLLQFDQEPTFGWISLFQNVQLFLLLVLLNNHQNSKYLFVYHVYEAFWFSYNLILIICLYVNIKFGEIFIERARWKFYKVNKNDYHLIFVWFIIIK